MPSGDNKSLETAGSTGTKGDESLPVKIEGLEETELTFVDFGMVQYVTDGMVVLSFFQGEQPFFRNDEELKKLDAVKMHCMVRLIMHPEQFKRLFELYKEILEKQQERLKGQEQGQGGDQK